jgi:hypothetical protein
MPLSDGAPPLIRANLEAVQNGTRASHPHNDGNGDPVERIDRYGNSVRDRAIFEVQAGILDPSFTLSCRKATTA